MDINKIIRIGCRDHIYGVHRPIYRAISHKQRFTARISLNSLSDGRHKCGPYKRCIHATLLNTIIGPYKSMNITKYEGGLCEYIRVVLVENHVPIGCFLPTR